MNGSQPYPILVFIALLAVLAIAATLWLRRRRAAATPAPTAAARHRSEPEYVVWYDEGPHGFTVWHAPDVALIEGDLVTRARNGNTPELEYIVREEDVHLVVLGTAKGAGRVVYKLGGRSSADPQSFNAVRVA